MTFEAPDGPPPELSTTRVAGGASARMVAVAVAGLLVGVVGFAVVNRPPAPAAPSPSAAPVAVVPTPAPSPSPPRNQLPLVRPQASGSPTRTYRYAAVMSITGGLLRAALDRQVEDVYGGTVAIESADVGSTIEISVGRQWSEGGLQIFESFDTWNVALKPLRRSRAGLVELLVAHVPPRLTRLNGPQPTATGYTFTVTGRRDGTRMTLLLEFVWPVASQLEAAYSGPRGPGLFNRCRWDVGPQAAAPRSSHDEAGCPG